MTFLIATLSSGFGIGGGIFFVPLILFLGRYHSLPENALGQIAVANSLLLAFILSFSGTYVNLKKNLLLKNLTIPFLSGGIPGILIGTAIITYLNTLQIKLIFGIFVLITGLKGLLEIILKQKNLLPDRQFSGAWRLLILIITGFFTSLLSTLTGTGGGVIMIPLFSYFAPEEKLEKSIATSTFMMAIFSFLSTILFSLQNRISLPDPSIGYFYLPFTIPSIAGAFAGGFLGASIKSRIPETNLKLALSLLQIFIGSNTLIHG